MSAHDRLDDIASDEINACSVEIEADVDGADMNLAPMFKNETHNYPTEIEPFGGAATCIGGAIQTRCCGRSTFTACVFQVLVTYADFRTRAGKLPQQAGFENSGSWLFFVTKLVWQTTPTSVNTHPG